MDKLSSSVSRNPFSNLNGNSNCELNGGQTENLGPTHIALITSLVASTRQI